MLCNQLPDSIEIPWGTFRTTNSYSDYTYSFYRDSDDLHFTVTDTGGGHNEFRKFHISSGSFNAHLWFDGGYPAPDRPWDNDRAFGSNLPSSEWAEFAKWAQSNWGDITANAMEFWTKAQAAG